MPTFAKVKLTDIDGTDLGLLTRYAGLEIDVPLNDSRTGNITISMYDPISRLIRPIDRMIKVYLSDYPEPVFWGHIVQPVKDYAAGTITCSLHDPTIKLKHNFHRFGDIVVDAGYPIDGTGVMQLIESAIPYVGSSVKPLGIDWGTAVGNFQPPGSLLRGKCERGENIWDSLQKLVQKAVGPDIEFEPLDNLGTGYFCVVNSGAKPDDPGGGESMSRDLHEDVKFIYGINAENLIPQPDGNAMRNYYVAVNPGGEKARHDPDNKALYHNSASWNQYGIFEGWESVGEKVSHDTLLSDARAWVTAYAYPPNYFQVVPKASADNVPRWPNDFKVGDFIGAAGSKAGHEFEEVGRVVRIGITQPFSGSAQVKLTVDCVPLNSIPGAEGDL